jgi:hypothetical protein
VSAARRRPKPHERFDAEGRADAVDQSLQLMVWDVSAQRCEGVLDPGEAQATVHRQLRGSDPLERQAQDCAHLRLVGEDPSRVALGHDLQAR